MLKIAVAVLVILVACSRPNPAVCCATDDQCAALGVSDGLRPCGVGQACDPSFTCVAAECATSADCTSPDKPVCSLGFCVESCESDNDCADPDLPLCAADGACVGCIDSSTCPQERPFCDAEARSCRGCERDSECESGVCLEADQVCAETAAVIFVNASGSDVGTCTEDAPCDSLNYAFTQVSPTRRVIHISGGVSEVVGTISVTGSNGLFIDGTDTTINGNGTLFDVVAGAAVTFNKVKFLPNATTVILGHDNSTIRVFQSAVSRPVETQGGLLDLNRVSGAALTRCQTGTLSVRDSTFDNGTINTSDCQVTVTQTRMNDSSVSITGGGILFENNVAVVANGLDDFMFITAVVSTSAVRFNTFINTTSVPSDGVAIACQATLDVSSNIFAYRSMHPFQNGCGAKFSVFDEVAIATQREGEGNATADVGDIFVDFEGRDFHPSATSLAREAADPNLTITQDFGHGVRPQPFGTTADVGALEVP